ncbi:MAG: EAL domain-containing response regulator [Methyloversatilis sp.]|uniref:EAL domain-containing response regulator n=1 Tax=Methyloversatilis sp. TaxID=2569862 RepID=UPI0025E9FD09|nr:EAL domain-containing response regulator [Methyloversatilis sp.]MCR6664699.1 EAL domain-containing response regulator [Methyloversatilis sp.]
MRVLIVDDDRFTLRLLTRQLTQLGVDGVFACDSASAALTLIDGQIDSVDVLFCDLNMPGMDGVEFLRHLSRHGYRGGLVLISGEDVRVLDSVRRLATARQLQVWGTLRKPVALESIRALLQPAADGARSGSEPEFRKRYEAAELGQAVRQGQIVNHYQPKVAFSDARVVGVETLVRWAHPQDGLVFPDQFIAAAESGGVIEELTDAVLHVALRDTRSWNESGLELRCAINVSMDNLVALDFPDRVASAAARAGVPIAQLVLEVTESQLMHDTPSLLDIVSRLRLKRIGLSIDDFGTGFSSLAQLRDIPFDELKLDRSFVRGAGENAELLAILRANLDMARQLGLRSVAEGVETAGDWACLRDLGCDVAQGYFIARPMPADRLPEWMAEWEARRTLLVNKA